MKMLEKCSQWKIDPTPISNATGISELIDGTFLAYNASRLRESCDLFSQKMLKENVFVGISISGALTPAGIGQSCLIPLMEAGFVDWIVSTGANLYHDTHFALDFDLHQSGPRHDDLQLREHRIIRIYDILFEEEVLLNTDRFYHQLLQTEPFQRTMGSAEFHWLIGKFLAARDQQLQRPPRSILSCAHQLDIPVYTSAPGDSSMALSAAALSLKESKLRIDPWIDINETAALVYDAQKKGKNAALILGGGTPKNFLLQTEPHIQEILGLESCGYDYFLQFTDARPDTGGLSGATPSEAMTWGKLDPKQLPDAVTCYVDATIGFPLLCAYALANHVPREPRRLYRTLNEKLTALRHDYRKQLTSQSESISVEQQDIS